MSFFDDAIHIFSAHDFWRIIWESSSNKPALYHRNHIEFRQEDDTIEHYHRQKHVPGDIMKQIGYIVEHDAYVTKQRNGQKVKDKSLNPYTKKGRKQIHRQKELKRKQQISRVLTLIDELSEIKG